MTANDSNPSGTGHVTASYASELMKNYSPEMPVDATYQLAALQTGDTPWVFSVGTDDTLYAVTRREGSGSGWVQHPLSAGMGAVTAFGSTVVEGGAFRLGLAVRTDGVSRFYLSAPTDFAGMELEHLDTASFWTEHALMEPTATVNQVRVDATGALIATTDVDRDARWYTVDPAGIRPYDLPEHGSTVLALELGSVYGQRGVFLLYTVGPAQTLLFHSFPDPVYGRTSKYRFAPPGTVNDFVLLPGAEGTNWLVAAGSAVTLFTTPDQELQPVAPVTPGLTFTTVRAAERDGALSVWLLGARGGGQSLYYATNQFYQGSTGTFTRKWTAPLPIRPQVGRFECLRGAEVSNHLFVVSQQNTLVHLWQDAASTLWHEAEIPVHDTGKIRELDTYTVHVQFSPANLRETVAGKTVAVTASSAMYAELNGAGYRLGPGMPVQVALDTSGHLNVMTVTSGLAAPTLTVTAPFLDVPLVIDMMHRVRERLRSIKTGADLQAATRFDPATNSPVPLTTGQDTETLDAVAWGLARLTDAADGMQHNPSAARADSRAFAVASGPTPQGASWGMSFTGGGGAAFPGNDAVRLRLMADVGGGTPTIAFSSASANSIWDDLGHAFGDVIRGIGHVLEDVKEFLVEVVGEVVRFAVRVGEVVYRFILTTAQEVFAAVEWLFRKIALGIKEIVQWVGFIFNWHDILVTRDGLKTLFNNGMNAFSGTVRRIRVEFDGWVERVVARDLDSPELARRLHAMSERTVDEGATHTGAGAQAAADPRLHWVSTRIPHLARADAISGAESTPGGALGEILASVASLAGDFTVEFEKVSTLGDDWVNGRITTGEFATAVLNALGALALDLVKRIVDAVLDAVSLLADGLSSFLNEDIEIPFFSALYRWISCNAPSLLDVVALVLAIPVTVAYKLLFNEEPFKNGIGSDLLTEPARFFSRFSLDGKNGGGVYAMMAPSRSAGENVAAVIVAITRIVRAITFGLVTALTLSPAAIGTPILLVLDHFVRAVGALAGLMVGETTVLEGLSVVVYILFFIVNATLHHQQRSTRTLTIWRAATPPQLARKLGENFNLGALIDGACVTAIGIWNAVLTAEGWDKKPPSQRASEIMSETFQIPAIFGFLANTVARNTGDPYTLAAAAGLAVIRTTAMAGSGISELVRAAEG